ncbi:flagellar motor protein MotB [Rheinheimera baltica]|uniref:flagellar motor protein MotB n=1 Tax=Rheinheimera baltica TaxID=67576 RepID=UPI00273E2724|nr:flagellar motor protein MotB [Rheinheimera baltica]MDP5149857.1 OmpA family protein [Rheinheimera baltica]
MYRHKQKHKYVEQEQLDRWLVSYADYMTLMFALFVVLYAMSIVKEEEYDVLANSLTQMFEKPQPSSSSQPAQSLLPEPVVQKEIALYGASVVPADIHQLSDVAQRKLGSPLHSVEEQLTQALASLLEQGVAKLQQDENWLIIELSSALLFASGSATTTQSAQTVLNEIATVINPIENFIRVRGYTDDQPINNELFVSNWELSVARATSVLRVLERSGTASERLAIEGYGQYYPFNPNDSVQGRAANRKVVIAISRYGYQASSTEETDETAARAVEADTLQRQLEQVSQQDGSIKVITLPGGGIRVTTRDESPDVEPPEQQEP